MSSIAAVSGNWLAVSLDFNFEDYIAEGLAVSVLNIQSKDNKVLDPCFHRLIHCLYDLKVKKDLVFALDDHLRAVVRSA